jgi:hypothetical protein
MRKTRSTIIAAAALVAFVAAPIAASAGKTSKLDTNLQATGSDADARGRAKFRLRGSEDGRFEIKAQRLDRSAVYEVIVNGVRVGDLATSGGGSGKLRFRSEPRSDTHLFLGFDPRGSSVVVRNALGSDVLAASIPVDDGSGNGSTSDGDVICCTADDSGPHCEDRTPEACVAEGGTLSAATSCLPNPCDAVTPPGEDDIVCCTPDDSGPNCEDRTPAECALTGGVAVTATSCLDNPCAAIAPSDADIRCCLAGSSAAECEDRTAGECLAQGGVSLGAGVCGLDDCAGVTLPGGGGGNGNATVLVTCEKRSTRSRASVNGSNLASGNYTARLISGSNEATAPAAPTIGDQVEFDFDSNTEPGATRIAIDFLQGTPPQATGQILHADGSILASATVTCTVK